MCVSKLGQGARKLTFGVVVALGGEVQECQNGAWDFDFDPENEVKVQRSQNFDWLYLRYILSQNRCLVSDSRTSFLFL